MSKPNVDIKQRRVALVVWSLAIVVWALFAIKDSKHEPNARQADSCTRALVMKHLESESSNPLFGASNVSIGDKR